jgi:hypothetical protein
MIPLPILVMLANFTGNPIIVTIIPMQSPRIEIRSPFPVPAVQSAVEPVGNCYSLICKA